MVRKRQQTAEEQERLEERGRQILDAAALVFARHGYHRASTHEIAAVAGVAQGTIYNYYRSKRELLLALLQRIITESLPALPEADHAKSPREWLIHVLSDRLDMAYRNRDLIMAVAPELFGDQGLQHEYFRQVATPAVEWFLPLVNYALRDLPLRNINPRTVLPMIVGAIIAAVIGNERADWSLGSPVSRQELAGEIADFLLGGLIDHDQISASRI